MGIQLLELLFIAALAFWFGRESVLQSHEHTSNKRHVDWYNTTHLNKTGWTSFIGGKKGTSYDLRSFDSGKTWYDVSRTDDGRVIINGLADPKLLEHLEAMDNLNAHISNGPIQMDNPHPDEIRLLQNAGFTVTGTPK